MAEIIELQDEQGDVNNIPTGSNEVTENNSAITTNEPIEASVPDKYRGKSLDEIVKMHQEAEKLIGRQAQEVGEVRKLADDLIKQQLNTNKQDTQPSALDNEIDYFSDPDKAVNHAVENNPIVRQLKEQQEVQMRQQQAAQLQSKFPNFQEIVSSPDFSDWIKSSRVRLDLFAKANNFDMDSAEELLDTYTTIKGIKAQQANDADKQLINNEEQNRNKQLKSAAVQKGGSGEVGKPIYRRVDLIRLRMTDPERYNALQDDIMSAYADGRVK
jgi:hypothetical protein